MKSKIHLAARILAAFIIVLSFSSCRSSKKAAKPSDFGEVLIEQHCSGKDFQSTKDYFRANSVGESMDQNVAKQKSLSNARTLLAQQLEMTLKNVTDSYVKSVESGNVEDLAERFEGLTREVTNQKLSGTRIICEKLTVTKDGNYKSYIALELGGDEIAASMRQRLSNDTKLKIDFDYERFKKTFEQEMNKFEQER